MGPESHVTKRNGRFWGKNDTKVAKKVVGVEGGGGGGEGLGLAGKLLLCMASENIFFFFP